MKVSKYSQLLIRYLQYHSKYLIILRLLKEGRFDTIEKVEEFQLERLKEMIHYAYKYVPYYQRTFDEIGFRPDEFRTFQDLKKIPFLTKQIIRENREELISTEFPRKYLKVVKTGGTTGMPLEFLLDSRYATLTEMVYLKHMWKRVGYRQRDRCIVLREDNVDGIVEGKKYWKRDLLTNWLVMSAFHLNADTFEVFYRKIQSYKPKFILAFPSNAYLLAKYIKENNLDPFPSLQAVICASENLYDWQRKEMTEIFQARIFSYYGHSEKCILAAECSRSESFEFYPSYGYVELINLDGLECTSENEIGEIIATGFNNFASPFIRYKTDDVGTYTTKRGSDHPQWFNIKKIEGRIQDFLIDRDNVPKTYMHIDRPFWNIREKVYAYQYIQDEPGKVWLHIHSKNGLDQKEIAKVKETFLNTYLKFDLEIKLVDHIPRSKSGKFRYLVQNIKIN